MTETFLVVGMDGQIGREVMGGFRAWGTDVRGTTRRPNGTSHGVIFLDLSHDVSLWKAPSNVSVAIFCAAVSTLEGCRRDPGGSRKINVENTLRVAEKLVRTGARVIFLSSNQVFDGAIPHSPADRVVSPLTEYGRQKVDSEKGLLGLGDRVAILRLSKVFRGVSPLLADWVKTLREGGIIHPFSDVRMAPLPAGFVVDVLRRLCISFRPGVWQVSASDDVTYAEAARFLSRGLGTHEHQVQPVLVRDSMPGGEEWPWYSSLDCSRLQRELGMSAPDLWKTIEGAAGL